MPRLNAARVAVSRLRRVLEDGDGGEVLVTRPGGYLLQAGPEQLDVALFERLLRRRASGCSAAGDAAWRPRACERRWRCGAGRRWPIWRCSSSFSPRSGAWRSCGCWRGWSGSTPISCSAPIAELIAELEGLVASNPLQERLRAQLMLALYRAGRQADALEVYRQTSELLRDELGLEPGRELQELERRVLRQDRGAGPASGSARGTARADAEERAVCPYKGLASFDRSDAEYFCGRERLVSDLVARLAESTVVGIVGPSGIGKSSLLRAGLLVGAERRARCRAAGIGDRCCCGPASGRARSWRERSGVSELPRRVVRAGAGRADRGRGGPARGAVHGVRARGRAAAFLDQLARRPMTPSGGCCLGVAARGLLRSLCCRTRALRSCSARSHVLVGPMRRDELARRSSCRPPARGSRSSQRWLSVSLPMWRVSPGAAAAVNDAAGVVAVRATGACCGLQSYARERRRARRGRSAGRGRVCAA